MKKIQLTQGQFAIVDDEDYEFLAKFKWHAALGAYASTTSPQINGNPKTRKTIFMHRLIIGAQKGQLVDHQNHLILDNRRINLRIVNAEENAKNAKLSRNNTSGVCGVNFNKATNRWVAKIGKGNGGIRYVKHFKTFEEAVTARKEAEKHFGFHENHGCLLHEIATA